MSEKRRIRVVGKQHPQPDLKALAKAVIELARLLDTQPDQPAKPDIKPDTKAEEVG